MKDRRRFLAPRDLWDAGTIEAWLEEKAAQGWILEKWGISARFERIDPCRCRVRLDPKDRRNRQQQAEAEQCTRGNPGTGRPCGSCPRCPANTLSNSPIKAQRAPYCPDKR